MPRTGISVRQFAIFRILSGAALVSSYTPPFAGALQALLSGHPGGAIPATVHSIGFGLAALGGALVFLGLGRRVGAALAMVAPWAPVIQAGLSPAIADLRWSAFHFPLSAGIAVVFLLRSAPALLLLLAPRGDRFAAQRGEAEWRLSAPLQYLNAALLLGSTATLAVFPIYFSELLPWCLLYLILFVDWRILPGRRTTPENPPVAFFDGVCGLCDATVDFLMAEDDRKRLRFAAIQGRYAASALPEELRVALNSFALRDAEGLHTKSEAALRAAEYLGGIWSLGFVARLIPRRLRDRIYDWIARNRYRWFGVKESCRLPTAEERERFFP